MKKIPLLLICVALASCATWKNFNAGLESFVGKPLSSAIQVLGYPSDDQMVAGMRIISWQDNVSGVMALPDASYTTGSISSHGQYGTFRSSTISTSYVPMHGSCKISMKIDENEIIQGFNYSGNRYGCENFMQSVRQYRSMKAKEQRLLHSK